MAKVHTTQPTVVPTRSGEDGGDGSRSGDWSSDSPRKRSEVSSPLDLPRSFEGEQTKSPRTLGVRTLVSVLLHVQG